MKKSSRRSIMAILLAFTLIFSLTSTAFASDKNTRYRTTPTKSVTFGDHGSFNLSTSFKNPTAVFWIKGGSNSGTDKIRYTVQIKDNSTGKIVYTTHIYGNGGKVAKTLSKDNTSSTSYNFYFSIYSGTWSGQHVTARAYFTD